MTVIRNNFDGEKKSTRQTSSTITIHEPDEKTVSVTFDRLLFLQLHEMIEVLAGCCEVSIQRKQEVLNKVFEKGITASPHYLKDNLQALAFFNEIAAVMSRHTDHIQDLNDAIHHHINQY